MDRVKIKKELVSYIYIIPSVIFMFFFVMIPIILSIVMSFFRMESLSSEWIYVGFENFALAFRNSDFLWSLGRTLVFGAFSVVSSLFFGLLIALLVSHHKMLNFYRYIFYLPSVVSAITMGRLYGLMLMPSNTGVLNSILNAIGFINEPVNWLGNGNVTFWTVICLGFIGCGGGMTLLLFSTAINNIPEELNEAARLEGASGAVLAVRITIPMISNVLTSWLILSLIGAFKSFEFIYALTGGGPVHATTTIAILLYESSKTSSAGYGYSAAMGLILTLIVSIVTFVYMYFSNFNKSSDIES